MPKFYAKFAPPYLTVKSLIIIIIIIITRHLWCVVSLPIIITKCTDGKHGNYDLTVIILLNNHYDLNFNVGLSDDSKK